ncbi:MAG: dTDP-4-dehydrorhamnose 3,5-epimerase [Elusimicrobia bacterium CG11_big_fil_rev_8_21_14_0_20_64_6]|nr:MAG: dTDP-4-dehydrorhamnose 3,5-epimerase [Elusimicrobia bacterium CG11_big_fil_rev_8_21_14_0_20_64_6]
MALTFTPYGGIDGLLVVEGPYFPDERGFFFESFRADDWSKAGLPPLLQDNLSRSKKGVVRGLHYQIPPQAVGKLVRCSRGRIFDAVVDIRKNSPTYGKSASIELDDTGNRMFWVPAGFAHGFCALSESADASYKVTGYWSKPVDAGIRWNDPALGIQWPLAPAEALVTAKDAALPLLADAGTPF